MYHAKDRHLNVPLTELQGKRGGTDNSLTRIVMKPTHFIGGYAQLSFGFNYYGPDRLAARRGHGAAQARDGGDVRVKIRAQVGMVMNLDKCIGCHTCSVTCKQVWTNRPGAEYMWFNDVETKPGRRLPEALGGPGAVARRLGARPQGPAAAEGRRADQEAAADLLQPRPAADRRLLRAVDLRLREADHRAALEARPGRPRALAAHRQGAARRSSGARTGTTTSPGAPERIHQDPLTDGIQEQVKATYEQAFMFYLPRICEHCLNPSCVASCPSGAMYKREEDGIVLVDQAKCRGWRFCVSGCPYKKVYFNHRTGKAEKCTLCYPRIEVGPADDLLGDLRRADPLHRARALRLRPRRGGRLGARRARPARRPARRLPRSRGPRRARAGRARRDPRRLDRGGAALAGVRARAPLPGRAAAAPRVPDAADGLVRAAALADRQQPRDRRLRGRPRPRLPGDRRDADPGRLPRQPARRRRRRGDPRRAAPAGRDARPHAQARGARRARRGDAPPRSG